VSAICPRGHESAATDYCDQCGARIEGTPVSADAPRHEHDQPATSAPHQLDDDVTDTEEVIDRPVSTNVERCPTCQTARTGDDRYCEVDGYDFVAGAGPTPVVRWVAIATADRSYYDELAPDDVAFPANYEPRTFALDSDEVMIGRRSATRGIEPQIDLSDTPLDDSISHRHAVLARCSDGSYAVIDVGSRNGTSINGSIHPIPLDTPVPLADGDRIHVGAWTTLTIRSVMA
jgi:FHA domain